MIKEIYKGLKIDFHPASFIIGGSWIDEYAKELGERKTFDFIYKNIKKQEMIKKGYFNYNYLLSEIKELCETEIYFIKPVKYEEYINILL